MKDQFKQLLIDYRDKVDESVALLRQNAKRFGNYREIRRGYFDEARNIRFKFHGIGCLVCFDDVLVDFNFLYYTSSSAIRYDAIHKWFLFWYWRSKKNEYGKIKNYEDVADRLFAELIQDGFLVSGKNEDDYFLKTDLENYTNRSVLFPDTKD